MAAKFHHESIFRGEAQLAKLKDFKIVLCGAGALGSNLTETLARQGCGSLRVIDNDRIEEHNVSTQVYGISDVGAWKAEALRNRLYRAVSVEIDAVRKKLIDQNARTLLKDAALVVDTFDNAASRAAVQAHCRAANVPCLHAGLYADYCEIVWDEHYRVPRDVGGDVCDYPLARNLVLLAVAIAAEVIVRFVLTGSCESYSATLGDFAVRRFETS